MLQHLAKHHSKITNKFKCGKTNISKVLLAQLQIMIKHVANHVANHELKDELNKSRSFGLSTNSSSDEDQNYLSGFVR